MPPPEQAESSKSQNPVVVKREEEVEDDDDDLDDLDDVLASFNTTQTQKTSILPTPPIQPTFTPSNPTKASSPPPVTNNDDEDFEASLMEGMDALLKQLAGDHPPGPMADKSGPIKQEKLPNLGSGLGGGMSKEAEEEAWQKALEMVLSGEGLKAMGLGDDEDDNEHDQVDRKANINNNNETKPNLKQPSKSNYEETLAKTLESLNKAGTKPSGNGSGGSGGQPDLSALLAGLGGDPDLLKDLNFGGGGGGEGDNGDDGDLADVLEGMMKQLMTKEVLEEPMTELASKYPPYLASPPHPLTSEEKEKYQKQNEIVQKIVQIFKKPNYSDGKDGAAISELVSHMQDLGGPPKEIIGDLPEGFDLGALGSLGNEDGCTIM